MSDTPHAFLEEYRGKAFSGEWPSIPALFRINAERFPARKAFTALDPEPLSFTYGESAARMDGIAIALRNAGVKRGDKVALTGKNSPEWALSYLGILAAGATVVPIDYQLRKDEVDNLVRASDARGAIVDEEKFDELDAAKLGLSFKWSLSPSKPGYVLDIGPMAGAKLEDPAASELAAILFTSGTTGQPKGVMLSHENLVADCFLAQANLKISENDVFYALLPIHHSYTMLAVFIESLSVGAETVFGKRMVTKQILKELREAKITMFLGVPLLFNKVLAGIMKGVRAKGPIAYGLIRGLMGISGFIKKLTGRNPGKRIFHSVLEKASLSTIRICISGGGPLAPSVFRRYNQLGIDFIQGYGLTETSPILTLNPKERYKETSVGKLIPGVQMRILDPDERGVGEIAVKGPMVMKGYYKNAAATAEVFTADGWFMTGDVGYLDQDNYLYLTGRAKNLIVTEGGKNVYPEEIENCFQLFEEVEQVLVRGFDAAGPDKREGIEALIYPSKDYFSALAEKAGHEIGAQEIQAAIGDVIAKVNATLLPYQRIERTTILDEPLEMTTTKKIKRHSIGA
jgi:long-chain acyl-CoA synthetase